MSFLRTCATFAPVLAFTAACTQQPAPSQSAATPPKSAVERGGYLVIVGGCDDCHTPKKFGPAGAEPDMSRRLSGHPASEKPMPVPANLIAPDKWGAVINNHLTEWAGPWGVSFTRNLTPDQATGLGSWTEDMFLKTIHNGKHQGEGRPLLPPMPWQNYKQMTDEDLKAIFAFLKSLPPINNAVPDPIAPEQLAK
jgi:mono/diheme cytochrome c family protein